MVEECLKSGYTLEYILIRSDIDLGKYPEILNPIAKTKTIVEPLPAKSFKKLTDTESSQGIIGIVSLPAEKKISDKGNIVIALDKLSDPGNLGTIIRTAYWFGVKTILVSEDSADPYNPKVIRSSQGGIFHINVNEDKDLPKELTRLKSDGYSVYLFTLSADKTLQDIYLSETKSDKSDKFGKSVIVFGSEAHGISKEILEMGFDQVRIEGKSGCESLNAAIACGIALYELRNNVS